jgi:CRP-like cAMP-binding protein
MTIRPTLKQMPIFEGFRDEELSAIEHALTIADYEDSHEFILEGDEQFSQGKDAMYIVIDGEVNVMVKDKDSDTYHNVSTLKSGDVFGILSLISPGKRAATCLAKGLVKAASLNKAAFDYLINANVALGARFQFALVKQLARDLRIANEVLYRELSESASQT